MLMIAKMIPYLPPVEAMTISSPTFQVTVSIRVRVLELLLAVWARRVQVIGIGMPEEADLKFILHTKAI